jgi:hypothetical protein
MKDQLRRLTRGGEVLAVLRQDGRATDPDLDGQFTTEATFEPTPAFESVRHLFEREYELLAADEDARNKEWMDIWDELKAPGLFVESADGSERLDIVWVHVKDGRAWWWPLHNSPLTVLRRGPARP